MSAMASQITGFTIVYSTVYSGADQRKHQSSASLAFVREFMVTGEIPAQRASKMRKMFPFDDVIMIPWDTFYMSTMTPWYSRAFRITVSSCGENHRQPVDFSHEEPVMPIFLCYWLGWNFVQNSRVVGVKWDLLTATRRRHKVLIISHNIFFNRSVQPNIAVKNIPLRT